MSSPSWSVYGDSLCHEGAILDHRFRLDEFLGEGPLHYVFRATDLLEFRSVCLKIPRRFLRKNEGFGLRYRRDVLDLLVHQHPGWSSPVMLGDHEGAPFQVLNLMDGLPLPLWYEENGRNARNLLTTLKTALKHLCDLHRILGRIHGGIKPSNLFVSSKGEPRFLDLVVTGRLEDQISPKIPRRPLTEIYFSPEQIVGERSGPAADIYSLGLVLYRTLALRHPFLNSAEQEQFAERPEKVMASLLDQLQQRPPAPSSFREDVPRWADRFLSHCLQPHPNERFPDPQTALDWLRNHARPQVSETTRVRILPPVGREAETAHLRQRLQELLADPSHGTVLRLRGTKGVGKTRVLRWLLDEADSQGIRTLEIEKSPESGLHLQSVTNALEHLGQQQGASSPGPVVEHLIETAMESPLLIVIEEIQQADETLVELLKELASVISDLPVLLLLVDDETPFRSEAARVFVAGLSHELRLGPLDRRAIANLIEEKAWTPPSTDLTNWIAQVSGGNPLAAGLLLEYLQESKQLREGLELEWLTAPPSERPDLETLVIRKLDRLDPTTRSLLEIGAVLGEIFNLSTLRAITYREEDEVDASLGQAVAAELIEVGTRTVALTYRWSHTMFLQILSRRLQPRRKQRIHRLAAAFYCRGEPHPTKLAYHFLQAGDDTELFYWGALAIQAAHRDGRRGETNSWLNTLLKRVPDGEWLGPDLVSAQREVARDQSEILDLSRWILWLCALSGRSGLEGVETLEPHDSLLWQVQRHLACRQPWPQWKAESKEFLFSLEMSKLNPKADPKTALKAVSLLRQEWGFRSQDGEPFPKEAD